MWIQGVSAVRKGPMAKKDKFLFLLDKVSAWSLYIMIFALPFSKSIVEITIVTALLAVMVKKIISRERFFGNTTIEKLLYVLLIAALISIFNTPREYMMLSVKALFSKSIKFAILFLMVKEILDTRIKLINFITMALLSCFIIIIDGFTQLYVTHVDFLHNYPVFKYVYLYNEGLHTIEYFMGFPTASFPFPNDFAAWMLIFIFFVGSLLFFNKEKIWLRLTYVAAFAGLLYLFILTKARGAWLGFIAALALLSFIKLKKSGALLLIIFLLLTMVVNRSLINDVFSLVSLGDRKVMWHNSWRICMEHPIIGSGLNTFYVKYAGIRNDQFKNQKGSYAHNCYLQMAAETGVVGLVSFLLFVIALILKGLRSLKNSKDPLLYSLILGIDMGLVAFLVHSFVDTNLYSLNLAALFWLFAGFLLAVIKLTESSI